jgi:hypothetical protein
MVIASKPSCSSWFEGVLAQRLRSLVSFHDPAVVAGRATLLNLVLQTPAQPASIEREPTGSGSGPRGCIELDPTGEARGFDCAPSGTKPARESNSSPEPSARRARAASRLS